MKNAFIFLFLIFTSLTWAGSREASEAEEDLFEETRNKIAEKTDISFLDYEGQDTWPSKLAKFRDELAEEFATFLDNTTDRVNENEVRLRSGLTPEQTEAAQKQFQKFLLEASICRTLARHEFGSEYGLGCTTGIIIGLIALMTADFFLFNFDLPFTFSQLKTASGQITWAIEPIKGQPVSVGRLIIAHIPLTIVASGFGAIFIGGPLGDLIHNINFFKKSFKNRAQAKFMKPFWKRLADRGYPQFEKQVSRLPKINYEFGIISDCSNALIPRANQ